MLRPEILQSQDKALEGPDIRSCLFRCLVCHDGCLLISLCVAPRLSFGALRKKKGALYACWLCISKSEEGKTHLEQFFHIPDAGFVHQEQDYVVVRLDPEVIVGDQNFVAAHDGADGGAFWQVDFIKPFTDHF